MKLALVSVRSVLRSALTPACMLKDSVLPSEPLRPTSTPPFQPWKKEIGSGLRSSLLSPGWGGGVGTGSGLGGGGGWVCCVSWARADVATAAVRARVRHVNERIRNLLEKDHQARARSASRISVSRISSLVGGAGAAGGGGVVRLSVLIPLISRKMQNATITKLITTVMKLP